MILSQVGQRYAESFHLVTTKRDGTKINEREREGDRQRDVYIQSRGLKGG